MARMVLTPWNGILTTEGQVSYAESIASWSIIRLQKEIIREFPVLKEKNAKVSYKIEYFRSIDDLKIRIKEIEKQKQGVPMLLYLYLDEPLD